MKTLALVLVVAAFWPLGGARGGNGSPFQPIRGRVIDASRAGVAGLNLQAIHDNAKHTGRAHGSTGSDGSFELLTQPGEAVNIIAASPAGFAFRPAVAPGSENVILEFRPGGKVRLKVQAPGGQPVSGLSVQGPTRINGAHYLEFYGVRTGADGVAVVSAPGGEVEFVVRDREGRTLATVQATVTAGEVSTAEVAVPASEPPR